LLDDYNCQADAIIPESPKVQAAIDAVLEACGIFHAGPFSHRLVMVVLEF
jgi:hypothetical protein